MKELLIQLRVKAFEERNKMLDTNEYADKTKEDRDKEKNIITNRFSLIFDLINDIESHVNFLYARYQLYICNFNIEH